MNSVLIIARRNNKSFTLIELLVVLALVAILSVVVILTLNPAELIKQARDSNRLSDLSTINTALNLFSADVTSGFMGTSTVVYVSIPSASPTCSGLGLPTLPSTYTYNCVTTANLRNTNGTGWIPVNFQRISSNSPISQLPIDPINTTSSGNYYTYVSGGSWILTAIPESQKQKTELSTSPHIQNYPGVIGMGNNLNLSPLYNPSGLVGYWKFDEGSGTTAKDSSGNGNEGTIVNSPVRSAGKISGAFQFDGTNYVSVPDAASVNPTTSITIGVWLKRGRTGVREIYFSKGNGGGDATTQYWLESDADNKCVFYLSRSGSTGIKITSNLLSITDTNWHFIVGTWDGSIQKLYLDGVEDSASISWSGAITTSTFIVSFGGLNGTSLGLAGLMDDVRLYNRALSAGEVIALYNATK